MKIISFENQEEWLAYRTGRVTGSRLKDLIVKRGTNEKIGFYQIIAEKIAVAPDDENPMDRGHRLEEEALELFSKEIGKKIDNSLVIWQDENIPEIALSPDGMISEKEAVEVKCLNSAKHIEAKLTGDFPKEYKEQVLHYFIVNPNLKTLHFVMYDPRMPDELQLLKFKIERKHIEEEIESTRQYIIDKIDNINKIVKQLTF